MPLHELEHQYAMVSRINARYRKRRGVPYAIEQFSGRQFRCRDCNEVFFTERQFDIHVKQILAQILAAYPR